MNLYFQLGVALAKYVGSYYCVLRDEDIQTFKESPPSKAAVQAARGGSPNKNNSASPERSNNKRATNSVLMAENLEKEKMSPLFCVELHAAL